MKTIIQHVNKILRKTIILVLSPKEVTLKLFLFHFFFKGITTLQLKLPSED